MRIAQPDVLRRMLKWRIEETFGPPAPGRRDGEHGNVSAAARSVGIPQSTLWQVVYGGRDVVTGHTLRCIRRLLPVPEKRWRAMIFWKKLGMYEQVVRAETAAHLSLYGLGLKRKPTGSAQIPDAAERKLERLWNEGLSAGHHPERLRLAEQRIRAPLTMAAYAGEHIPTDLALKVFKLGLRRERALLRAESGVGGTPGNRPRIEQRSGAGAQGRRSGGTGRPC